jgi:hypothetical protein
MKIVHNNLEKTRLEKKEQELKVLLKEVQDQLKIENFNSKEGINKRREALKKVGEASSKIAGVIGSSLSRREKAAKMQKILGTLSIASLVGGIYGLIKNSHIVKTGFLGLQSHMEYGGTFLLKAALILFILKIIHKILSKGGIFLKDLSGLWKDTKENVNKDVKESNAFISFNEYVVLNEDILIIKNKI